ncbi:TPA: hypothetical protein IAB95_05590 [Candidatus Ventrenecus avicola]|nr:hypothetical protein [Candidatus Ventrenecus avicola]
MQSRIQYDSLTEIDTTKVHEIPIIFSDYNTSDSVSGECTTPMESGASGNCQVGDYMTHPAFISIPSTGFWVGKFDVGYGQATTPSEAEQNLIDSTKIIIKPNTYIWREIQLANAFYTSYDYKRELDSHAMKNTEWGAITYLQHSAYGSATSVRINNNIDYITGYQANNEPTCGYTGNNENCNRYCNDNTCNQACPNSVFASTTNNITGMFDMSGGAWPIVMALMFDDTQNVITGREEGYNSGFKGVFADGTSNTSGKEVPDSKYYDAYQLSNDFYNYSTRILGDATGELGPFTTHYYAEVNLTRIVSSWYYADARFLSESYPFLGEVAV